MGEGGGDGHLEHGSRGDGFDLAVAEHGRALGAGDLVPGLHVQLAFDPGAEAAEAGVALVVVVGWPSLLWELVQRD